MQISNEKIDAILRRVKCLQLGGDVTAGDHVGASKICGRWYWIKMELFFWEESTFLNAYFGDGGMVDVGQQRHTNVRFPVINLIFLKI